MRERRWHLKPDRRPGRSNPGMDRLRGDSPAIAGRSHGTPAARWVVTRPGDDPAACEEREWVARARCGDEDAFRRLVERHQHRAYALALRMCRDAHAAEEVAQDAFVRAWRALPRFRAESAFGTWLHRIVVRRALDRLEVLQRRRASECPLDALPASAAAAGPVAPPVREVEAPERLLATLSEPQRLSVILYYLNDCSVQQVAATLGLPANTVKTHLSRARARMRAAWPRAGETP